MGALGSFGELIGTAIGILILIAVVVALIAGALGGGTYLIASGISAIGGGAPPDFITWMIGAGVVVAALGLAAVSA